jgi:flagellar hook protein FlgE
MLRSLFFGVSGLKNQQAYMDVIANNISNVIRWGYKSGRITFTDTLSDTLSDARGSLGNFGGVNPIQIGLGSRISSIDTDFTGGDLESTGLSTDLGLSGDGFFVVSDGSKNYYTRAGAFEIDSSGKIIAQGGTMYLQGRMADEDGNSHLVHRARGHHPAVRQEGPRQGDREHLAHL